MRIDISRRFALTLLALAVIHTIHLFYTAAQGGEPPACVENSAIHHT